MSYSIHYFSIEVQRQIAALPSSLRARYIALSARMLMYGPILGSLIQKRWGMGCLSCVSKLPTVLPVLSTVWK